jgi:hypothetical protein
MADEIMPNEAASEPAIIVDDTSSPPENDAEGGAAGNKGKGNNKKKREEKEQVPIEELYDLSKPIKKVCMVFSAKLLIHNIHSYHVHFYLMWHISYTIILI